MSDQQFRPSSSRRLFSIGLLAACVLSVAIGIFYQERELALLAERPSPEEHAENADAPWEKAAKLFKGKVLAHIMLDGPIEMKLEEGVLGDKASNAVKVRQALDAAAKDKRIKGVLLSINSPGGTVGMSQELHAAVERVRKAKPVVAHFGDVAASGGYYTGVAADRIVANPGSLTASIGVIISGFNVRELMTNKLGIKANTIKSGRHKDMLSPYREPTASDMALLQGIVDTSYQEFLNVVLTGRTKQVADQPKEKTQREAIIREIADGRVVTGTQAIEYKLVDSLGDVYAAHRVLDALVRERNEMADSDEPIPLENYSVESSVLSVLGLPSLRIEQAFGAMFPTANFSAVTVPFSARYPKQPLWILE